MTLEGIHAIYDDAYKAYQLEPVCGWSAKKAELYALRKVVEALRDEITQCVADNGGWDDSQWLDVCNKILASDGDGKAAGGSGQDAVPGSIKPSVMADGIDAAPAAAPDDVCEWTGDGSAWLSHCGTVWDQHFKDYSFGFCPSCGKPIKFKEGSE
jgi:hypothetical protein